MKRLITAMALLLLPMLAGCAHNYYNLPQETFADRLKVLGVLPIVVDADSDIRHPMKDELITILTTINRSHERDLLRLIKNSGNFYTVTMLDVDPKATFSSLLFRRERRDDAAIQYNKYFWKDAALGEFIRKNSLDALMIVVVSGIARPEKIRSSNLLDSLETQYNYLLMTAQIVDSKGTILWEYPNFRKRSLSYDPLLNLQYPNFDEAKANMSPTVQVKFKSIEGIKRVLEKRRLDILRRETPEVDLYMNQFEEMVSILDIDIDRKPSTKEAKPDNKPEPAKEEPVKIEPPKEKKPQ